MSRFTHSKHILLSIIKIQNFYRSRLRRKRLLKLLSEKREIRSYWEEYNKHFNVLNALNDIQNNYSKGQVFGIFSLREIEYGKKILKFFKWLKWSKLSQNLNFRRELAQIKISHYFRMKKLKLILLDKLRNTTSNIWLNGVHTREIVPTQIAIVNGILMGSRDVYFEDKNNKTYFADKSSKTFFDDKNNKTFFNDKYNKTYLDNSKTFYTSSDDHQMKQGNHDKTNNYNFLKHSADSDYRIFLKNAFSFRKEIAKYCRKECILSGISEGILSNYNRGGDDGLFNLFRDYSFLSIDQILSDFHLFKNSNSQFTLSWLNDHFQQVCIGSNYLVNKISVDFPCDIHNEFYLDISYDKILPFLLEIMNIGGIEDEVQKEPRKNMDGGELGDLPKEPDCDILRFEERCEQGRWQLDEYWNMLKE